MFEVHSPDWSQQVEHNLLCKSQMRLDQVPGGVSVKREKTVGS